jgi:hypothetical protein
MAPEEKMKQRYQLIRLKTGTVRALKRLMAEMAKCSLDELVDSMIGITRKYRFVLKETGWRSARRR